MKTRARMAAVLGVLCVLLVACGGSRAMSALDTGTAGASPGPSAPIIRITAARFAYDPASIELRKDQPVVLELSSADVHHGFDVPGLGVRADILPGQVTRVRLTPKQAGTFIFHCDYYCGSGHEGMAGQISVK